MLSLLMIVGAFLLALDPFPAAAWQRRAENEPWADFVGVTTLPLSVANAVFWVLSLQIPLYLWHRARKTGR